MSISSIQDIQRCVAEFAKERDWDKFHSPKNLAMALNIESAELMEHFQWLTEEQSHQLNDETHSAVKDELADVLVYLTRIADKLDIDLYQAVADKMAKNRKKYPIDQCFGSAKKYTAYANKG